MGYSVPRKFHKEDEDVSEDLEKLQNLLLALGRRSSLRDPIASMCEQLQFTPPQVHAILWLGQDGPLTMGELARRLGVTEKTVTGVVDRLERQGHLLRERSATDRRVVHCRLTEDGQSTWERLNRVVVHGMHQFLGILDVGDRKALFRILEKLVKRMSAPPTPATPAPRERTG
ncbi:MULTISPECIES: MarR family winged helix-turn-helix transcriptional regulator [Myxococcus]|uniref:MarR family transcriptional regulator n=1 Tax=Myxococcus xanthus TaxID=34 RepID=A0AAE6G5S4_MYXXA|nr:MULTISPECIES: MarR family transcriptional regulator [Myxococcus]QDE71473.1 MarR family transcriptional regulator [Myxococcus xanthus]QDE78753.1 MarR family transcriptional regulator [Myxococcus xanthus]QDE86121.1 MarR family transcriptional regulator [Myxococcus xanthus]QDF00299.1 MarR family transcriptional regulator [Myxococcus xanthus]QDF08073.1 MarR family transcriptional regulator [Myxococcus xanthus]